jgi:hypothetical protein
VGGVLSRQVTTASNHAMLKHAMLKYSMPNDQCQPINSNPLSIDGHVMLKKEPTVVKRSQPTRGDSKDKTKEKIACGAAVH